MPPDLRVTWTDLLVALLALQQANKEAGSLPRNSFDAYEQLDMSGSRTCHATAEFLAVWAQGLDALALAGEGLDRWLTSAVQWLREVDDQLAAASR